MDTLTAVSLHPGQQAQPVSDRDLDLGAERILTAFRNGHLTDRQASHALWGWAAHAAAVDTCVRRALHRRHPSHASTSIVVDTVRCHVFDVIHRKLVFQWRQRGGFDPDRRASFAGWVRNLSVAILHRHGSRLVAEQDRLIPAPDVPLLTNRAPEAIESLCPISDPGDLVAEAETSLSDLHADVWAEVTVTAQREIAPERRPMLSRQMYAAAYRVPPPARPLDPSDRRTVRSSLQTETGQDVCLAALRTKVLSVANGCDAAAYGWPAIDKELLTHPHMDLFRALWSPLDPVSAARVADTRDLSTWYAEGVTYPLPRRTQKTLNRFISAVKSLDDTSEGRSLLDQFARSWLAAELELVSPMAKRASEADREAQREAAVAAAAQFDSLLDAVTSSSRHPMGRRREGVLRRLRRIAEDTEVIDPNPLTAHRDLERLIRKIVADCDTSASL